jgi:hypothetical protein
MTTSQLTIIGHVKEEGMVRTDMHVRQILALYLFSIAVAVVVMMTFAGTSFAAVKQKSFPSAEDAVKALVTAVRNNDQKEMSAIFGSIGKDLLSSGDAVDDKQRREKFLKSYDEKNSLSPEGKNMILVIGKGDWPFPVPIVKKGEKWIFDAQKGKEEILNRRIGENELSTIQVCLAIVDAEREYAMKDNDGDGLPEYAEKFRSDQGKRNGLYWKAKEGEEQSPLGLLAAQARSEGYGERLSGGNPSPYHGYYYRILKSQGKTAPGGAYDYIIKGNMIGGFAVVAYPAKYGNSGVMTFIVNHDGVVYQKDLGQNTEKIAKAMMKYDPDKTWQKVKD